MMLIMMLAGLGMVVGNLLSGKISGRHGAALHYDRQGHSRDAAAIFALH